MSGQAELLVVAGESSGDLMAAAAVARLSSPAFGWGGAQLRAAGVETLTDVSVLAVMGFGPVVARAPLLLRAARRLLAAARARRPQAALLVGYSELNAWLGPRLRRQGTRVLWYAPPQIWAWRRRRGRTLRHACDRMAVILPFEEALWRSFGVDATYVGHPAAERPAASRAAARARLEVPSERTLVALLPGSRSQEVRRHLGEMLQAARMLRAQRPNLDARLLVAPALSPRVAEWVRRTAEQAKVQCLDEDPPGVLSAFDVALVASGTATLQCALANVPMVIAYRTDRLSALVAKRLVRIPWVGLPNLVLGRACFPELLQERLTADSLCTESSRLLDERALYLSYCQKVQERLDIAHRGEPSAQVAEMIRPWLS